MKHKILYGVCGIGSGHTYRQLPLIEHFSKSSVMVIFAYGESYRFYREHYAHNTHVTVVPVEVPFYVGNKNGLDFKATAKVNKTEHHDALSVNCRALDIASKILGKPDMVISDYEPISAQYAYALDAPLITVDQQSKYLLGDFPAELGGETYADEVMRLLMFFPKASTRIACSFFRVNKKKGDTEKVFLYPPIIKKAVTRLKRRTGVPQSILVYISSQKAFAQSMQEVARICATQKDFNFHVFISPGKKVDRTADRKNVFFYEHGAPQFARVLGECSGIITTAGHTLLSEAMYLGLPVYAIPLAVYEQQMNAEVINKNGFGIKYKHLSVQKLSYFVRNIGRFKAEIKNDREVLLKGSGDRKIIEYIEKHYLAR